MATEEEKLSQRGDVAVGRGTVARAVEHRREEDEEEGQAEEVRASNGRRRFDWVRYLSKFNN